MSLLEEREREKDGQLQQYVPLHLLSNVSGVPSAILDTSPNDETAEMVYITGNHSMSLDDGVTHLAQV